MNDELQDTPIDFLEVARESLKSVGNKDTETTAIALALMAQAASGVAIAERLDKLIDGVEGLAVQIARSAHRLGG